MINKIFPRKLNGSSDSRLRQPLDMVDALNVSVTEDFDSSGNEMGGDVGVLKPVKGNEVIQGLVGLSFTQGPVYPNYVEIVDGVPTANFVTSLTLDEVSEAVAAGGVENEFGEIVYTTYWVLYFSLCGLKIKMNRVFMLTIEMVYCLQFQLKVILLAGTEKFLLTVNLILTLQVL